MLQSLPTPVEALVQLQPRPPLLQRPAREGTGRRQRQMGESRSVVGSDKLSRGRGLDLGAGDGRGPARTHLSDCVLCNCVKRGLRQTPAVAAKAFTPHCQSCSCSKKWCPRADLNHRHADFQSAALPLSYSGPEKSGNGGGFLCCPTPLGALPIESDGGPWQAQNQSSSMSMLSSLSAGNPGKR
jgi:hypothetical protein